VAASSLTPTCPQVDGAVVGEKLEASNGVIYSMDTVLVPPFLLPAKVQPLTDILAFKGWAPEVVNGRLAMLGFVYALGGEFSAHQSFLGQVRRPIATLQQQQSLRWCGQHSVVTASLRQLSEPWSWDRNVLTGMS
jgi:hypothetical protein